MRKAETLWKGNARNETLTLTGRWNFHNELGAQFPISKLRVVYSKAGTLPASCLLQDDRTIVDHKLYCSVAANVMEARYLAAILNSETTRGRAAQYQSRGLWGARDFDKVMFNLPIPRFDGNN